MSTDLDDAVLARKDLIEKTIVLEFHRDNLIADACLRSSFRVIDAYPRNRNQTFDFRLQRQPDDELPTVSQETWSEIIGSTRSRVNFFMNKFRKLGFIEYRNRKIKINKSLLTFVLDG
jgi:Crp-like helix-turn-helix protein